MKIKITLKQEIIELVRLSATEDIKNVGFSSFWISIKTRGLISIKCYKSKTLGLVNEKNLVLG